MIGVPVYTRVFKARWIYPSFATFQRVIGDAMATQVAPPLVAMHQEVVADWLDQPTFKIDHETTHDEISVSLMVGGAGRSKWFWVDQGVKARIIRPNIHRQTAQRYRVKGREGRKMRRDPRRAALRFPDVDGTMIFRRMVFWPGIEPRKHTERIAAEFNPEFRRIMENAVLRARRAVWRTGE